MKFEIRKIAIINGTIETYNCEYIKLDNSYSFDDSARTSDYERTFKKILSKNKKQPSVTLNKILKMFHNSTKIAYSVITTESSWNPDEGLEHLCYYYPTGYYDVDQVWDDYNTDFSNLDQSNPFFIVSIKYHEKDRPMLQITCLLE